MDTDIPSHFNPASLPHDLAPLTNLSMQWSKINQAAVRITVFAEAPHAGYGITVSGILFIGEQAVIYVRALRPLPGNMFPQVIAKVHATTYIDAKYKPVFPAEYESYMKKYHN